MDPSTATNGDKPAAVAAEAGGESAGGEDWKTALKKPPSDERFMTEDVTLTKVTPFICLLQRSAVDSSFHLIAEAKAVVLPAFKAISCSTGAKQAMQKLFHILQTKDVVVIRGAGTSRAPEQETLRVLGTNTCEVPSLWHHCKAVLCEAAVGLYIRLRTCKKQHLWIVGVCIYCAAV